MDGASRGNPRLVGIGDILRDYSGFTHVVFTESVRSKDFNEVELLSIRRVLTLGAGLEEEKLAIESDSSNAIKWPRERSILLRG